MSQAEIWMKEAAPKRRKRPIPVPRGDCYESAGRYILDHKYDKPHLILVHGEVGGQGPIEGIRYGHAWVEDGDLVIDRSNGKDLQVPRVLYYGIGQVHPSDPPWEPNLHKYTVEQVMKNILKYRHWGPWDLKTSSGL